MTLPALHKRACELTADIEAIEQNVAFERTLSTGEKVLGFKTYDEAIHLQRATVERRAVIDQLRRGIAAAPDVLEPEFMA